MPNRISRRHWLRRVLVLLLGIGTVGALGLVFVVDRFGQVDRARRSPVIVVLGARILPDGTASTPLRARVDKAVALYRQGMAETLLFSGGVGLHPPAEAEVARALALAQGVPASACLMEPDSHSTHENAQRTAQLLRERGVSQVILVSDPYHLLRARQYFYREGIRAFPSPALLTERNLHPLERLFWTCREALALLTHPWLLWTRAP